MKKQGILNAQLISHIAALGHKDTFMIGDAGMPIPRGVPVVDLALIGGVPTFQQTLDAVLNETVVESYMLAEEIKEKNPETFHYIRECLPEQTFEMLSHALLKSCSDGCKFAVRTGEITPYSNIILTAACAF